MFLRRFTLSCLSSSLKASKSFPPNIFKFATVNSSRITGHRLYSEKVNLENMIVHFDDVKKATSNNKIVIIDVREPDELKEHGSIPNSINIPLGSVTNVLAMPEQEFEKTYGRKKPAEDTEIIFHCMIGKRSGKAQQEAYNLGYRNVKNYLGSWNDWASRI